MNITALLSGILVSIVIILYFKKKRLEKSKYIYSLLLFSFPLYYFLFAIYDFDFETLSLELLGGGLFFVLALLALTLNVFYKFALLSVGYVLHGVYDITHNLFFINKGTPTWWPEFCGAIDIIIGLYLLKLALAYRAKYNKIV
jgi:hypothetical protein